MSAFPCWRFRYEALGYEDIGAAIDDLSMADLDRIVTESGRGDDDDERGWRWLDALGDMCDRDDGHEGACRFVPQESVVLSFRCPQPAQEPNP